MQIQEGLLHRTLKLPCNKQNQETYKLEGNPSAAGRYSCQHINRNEKSCKISPTTGRYICMRINQTQESYKFRGASSNTDHCSCLRNELDKKTVKLGGTSSATGHCSIRRIN